MNAEQHTTYDVEKVFCWCFEESAVAAASARISPMSPRTPATKRKRKRADKTDPSKKISRKRAKKTEAASKPSVSEESPAKAENPIVEVAVTGPTSDETSAVYLDVDLWKAERESLDGSFKAARAHFLERGPWKLPADVGESKFRTVAKQTLMKMGR